KWTNSTMKIYNKCLQIFIENYTKQPVCQISISITKFKTESTMQLSLFDTKKWEDRRLSETVDNIRSVYGPAALVRAVSLTNAGTTLKRAKLVGGHKK